MYVKADSATLNTLEAEIAGAAGTLQKAVAELQAALDALGGKWLSVQSATAHRSVQTKLNETLDATRQLVAATSYGVGVHNTNLANVENAAVDMWSA